LGSNTPVFGSSNNYLTSPFQLSSQSAGAASNPFGAASTFGGFGVAGGGAPPVFGGFGGAQAAQPNALQAGAPALGSLEAAQPTGFSFGTPTGNPQGAWSVSVIKRLQLDVTSAGITFAMVFVHSVLCSKW
jgi:hypothetical protein